jgi:DNA-binding GntR family transcriptional regulator
MTTVHKHDILPPPTKADAVYVELRGQILRGVLSAGSRLDQEVLAGSLGVSTTPLREALRRLEADHLVIRAAHRDVMIAPISVSEARDLYAVRSHLDIMAVSLAATYMTEAELAAADAIIDAPPDEVSRYLQGRGIAHQALMARSRAFHHMLYSGSHNDVLIKTLDGLYARTERYAMLASEGSRGNINGSGQIPMDEATDSSATGAKERAVAHRAMLAAVARHDAKTAQRLVKAHDTVGQAVEQFLLGPLPQVRRGRQAMDTRDRTSSALIACWP